MQYQQIKRLLVGNQVCDNTKDVNYSLDRIKLHNKNETKLHFMVKAMIGKIVFDNGDHFCSELETRGGRVIDLLAIKKSGNLIGYEVETVSNKKPNIDNVDIIELRLKEVPDDIKDSLTKLETWLKERIV